MNYLIIILGATATGKTALSLALANYFETDILNIDSRQIYKEMSIGTAKPSAKVLQTVPHHFINHKHIHDYYSAGEYGKEAKAFCEMYFKKRNILIAVGGSGLYIKALVGDLDNFPQDEHLRKNLENEFQKKGITFLQETLEKLDKIHYQKIDSQNSRRLIRAIEISSLIQQPLSTYVAPKSHKTKVSYKIIKIGLEVPRLELYAKINQRVDEMLDMGLEKEAKKLYEYRNLKSLQTVGYKEFFDFFDKKTTYQETIERIKQNTRRYAKRQGTWFKKDDKIHWFSSNSYQDIISLLENLIKKQ